MKIVITIFFMGIVIRMLMLMCVGNSNVTMTSIVATIVRATLVVSAHANSPLDDDNFDFSVNESYDFAIRAHDIGSR